MAEETLNQVVPELDDAPVKRKRGRARKTEAPPAPTPEEEIPQTTDSPLPSPKAERIYKYMGREKEYMKEYVKESCVNHDPATTVGPNLTTSALCDNTKHTAKSGTSND